MHSPIEKLNSEIVACRLCPRLVAWREQVAREKRAAFANETYWGRPVPYFGDFAASRLIVGLAPAAHGANRTGRMFTGDRSGDFLFAALYRAGIASQPTSVAPDDGLVLYAALIAATCHCAPPANKPLPSEIEACSRYLSAVLALPQFRSVLCLGGIAWQQVHRVLKVRPPAFGHGALNRVGDLAIVACYHPSQQNTFTGKLTEEMIDAAVRVWSLGGVDDLVEQP